MKKVFMMLFGVIICCLFVTACKNNNDISKDFVTDEFHCVVCLPQEYDIFYVNDIQSTTSMLDKNLQNADTINGEQKKYGYKYYKVLKDESFKILTPVNVAEKNYEQHKTLVYWKLNDVLHRNLNKYDGENYYSESNFAVNQDTEITPIYYDFRPVGILLLEADQNDEPFVSDDEIFDIYGNIKEQKGVYYFYGIYDFEPYQNFWRTNLTINEYLIDTMTKPASGNYEKYFYTIKVKINKGDLFNSGNIIVYKLYKVLGHGYMTYGAAYLVQDSSKTQSFYIGEHELRFAFK